MTELQARGCADVRRAQNRSWGTNSPSGGSSSSRSGLLVGIGSACPLLNAYDAGMNFRRISQQLRRSRRRSWAKSWRAEDVGAPSILFEHEDPRPSRSCGEHSSSVCPSSRTADPRRG